MPSARWNGRNEMSSSRLPASAGRTMNSALNKTIEKMTAKPIVFSETCSSSGTCWFADHVSARYPSPSASPRPITPAQDRDLAVLVGPAGRLADVDLDVTFGHAHGDGVGVLAAHHHAFEHRLPAHVAGFGRTLAPGHDGYCYFFALAARRWKRSTRPPVSTSFCLPV